MPHHQESFHAGRRFLGPVWRDSNIRSGPSLDSPVVELVLPDPAVEYAVEGWSLGDEVVEGEHPDGVITSSVWFRLSAGRWTSAVNFEPAAVATVIPRSPVTA
ncbi:hypothetical protein ACFRJ1_30725 [Streptomyces sp. NPDC056773]|uniref:hypothetical protein n=1 Tax=unclassified Streptomyces TaxID=2593676 RepID=UPI0036760504